MIGHIAYAEGSPCPTLVLDRGLLLGEGGDPGQVLTETRRWMIDVGAGSVLKIALINPSRHPLFDLDYQFVQALPSGPDRFDFRGSCGHSILSSVLVASRIGWLSRLSPGHRVRVNVLNNGDNVVCEVDETNRDASRFTVYFLYQPERRLADLLITGTPTTTLNLRGRRLTVSMVSAGNPYVFVRARDLGVSSQAALFADDPRLFDSLVAVHDAAARLLGWPVDGVFPKVAAIDRYRTGRLAVRAVSVPRWHPTLALTGATCVAASTAIKGTIPYELAVQEREPTGELTLDTAGGVSRVSVSATGTDAQDLIAWVSVDQKLVRHLGSLTIEPLQHLVPKEDLACLSLPM